MSHVHNIHIFHIYFCTYSLKLNAPLGKRFDKISYKSVSLGTFDNFSLFNRALSILQQRNSQDITYEWLRKQDVSVDLKRAANDIMMQAIKQTEDRVAEVRRRAEEAVNDVKRQAVVELQKAVAAAESKANELVAAERAKIEKLLLGKHYTLHFCPCIL